jgi:hypothetical protein
MTPAQRMESNLSALLKSDTRPASAQDAISRHLGRKRTHMRTAAVGAAAVLTLLLTAMKNAGVTQLKPLKVGPMKPEAIRQLPGAEDAYDKAGTCWILSILLGLCYTNPSYLDNLIVPVDSKNVILLMLWQGEVVAIHMSLEVSTSYNNPDDDDVRPEIVLKGTALLRAANWKSTTTADLGNNNFGDPAIEAGALGLDVVGAAATPAALATALVAAGTFIALCTTSSTTAYIRLHCYIILAVIAGGFRAQQPWAGGVDLTIPNTDIGFANFSEFVAVRVPAKLRLYPALVGVPIAPAVTPSADLSFDLAALRKLYVRGNQGWDEGDRFYFGPDTRLPLALPAGNWDLAITAAARTGSTTLLARAGDKQLSASLTAKKGTVYLKGVQLAAGQQFVVGDGSWNFDLYAVVATPAGTPAPAPAPVVYTVSVAAPGAATQTFTAAKITAVLADGTIRTIPEAA